MPLVVAVNGETDQDKTDDAIHETKKMSEYTNGKHEQHRGSSLVLSVARCAGVDIPGSVDSNPLDKPQLPPISPQLDNGRPKTSNPNFR